MTTLKIGDRVAYTRAFLQSTGMFTGPVPFARGVVHALRPIDEERSIATVKWHTPGMPDQMHILSSNLVRADRIHLEPV